MEKNKMDIVDGGFLQSDQWIDFQAFFGKKIFKKNKKNSFRVNAISNKLSVVGSYLFVPRGPIFLAKNQENDCVDELIVMAKENGSAWVRIEPQTKVDLKNIKIFVQNKGFSIVKSKKDHQPAQTLIIDISKTEDEILSAMKSKTRYNVRLAKKRGVEVSVDFTAEAIEAFLQLSEETAKRDGIMIHPREYYEKMLESISKENLKLYVARFEGEIIASALVSFFGSVVTYLHGASSNKNRNVMASHLLQWSVICDARKQGFSKYDFGGTKIQKDEDDKLIKNNWSGITKFKVGFSPNTEVVKFPGCWDIVIDKKKYYTYKVLQSIKDILRKLKIKKA